MSDTATLVICGLLVFIAAHGEEILAIEWPAAARRLGLLTLLALTACAIDDGPQSYGDCHRDCGVLRDSCHAACDESLACTPDAGDHDMSGVGGGGEDGAP